MESQSSVGTFQSPSTRSDSEKTGSSSKSGESTGKEKELDLTKDNVASPIDLECHIQAERITKILNEAIYKTKLAVCLPNLVYEYKTISSTLSPQHMDDLMFIFEQYDNPLFSASLLNMAAMEDIKMGDFTLKNRLNPELGHLIYILNNYESLRSKVETMIEEMENHYQRQTEGNTIPILEYLYTLEHFRDLMVEQMNTTAAEEIAAKINTRKLEASNAKLIDTINEYTESLKKESEEFEQNMAVKSDTIAKLEQELSFLNHEASVKLKKKVLDSDRQMVLTTRAHAVKKEMLKEEEIETRESFENLLKQHLIDEKNQRARRFKVETQLLSWLQKYDTEMTDKQKDLDELREKYEEEEERCKKIEKDLEEQDKEYLPLMKERDEEYHAEMTEKMNKFLLEHAARVIQCAWREVLANRAEKKKLKKLQQKMKAAAEKAEKLREKAEAKAKALEKKNKKKEKK